MAVRSVLIFQVTPGRREDFLKQAAKAKSHFDRLGGRFRLAEIALGGPNSGHMVATVDYDDMAAYAAWMQKSHADSEWQKFQAEINNDEKPPRTQLSRALLVDIPV